MDSSISDHLLHCVAYELGQRIAYSQPLSNASITDAPIHRVDPRFVKLGVIS